LKNKEFLSGIREFESAKFERAFIHATRTCNVACPAPSSRNPVSTLRRFRSRIDLHGTRHAGHQADAIQYLIDVDAHRRTLRKAHPGEDRIYRG
jgi:hypothetical protein